MTRVLPIVLSFAAVTALAACHNGPPREDGSIRAEAHLLDTLGREVGVVRMVEAPGQPGVMVTIDIGHATPGQHGIHFHTVGKCDPPALFASAGGHFNPGGRRHGLFAPDGPHAGDLEAITVDEFGHASFVSSNSRITLSAGPNSLLDADGSAVVLHALPDDQRTDPSGNSGSRIACGVLTRTATVP